MNIVVNSVVEDNNLLQVSGIVTPNGKSMTKKDLIKAVYDAIVKHIVVEDSNIPDDLPQIDVTLASGVPFSDSRVMFLAEIVAIDENAKLRLEPFEENI